MKFEFLVSFDTIYIRGHQMAGDIRPVDALHLVRRLVGKNDNEAQYWLVNF